MPGKQKEFGGMPEIYYTCYLTGENETPPLEDIELGITTLSVRFEPTSIVITISIPGLEMLGDINVRPNGEIVIEMVKNGVSVEFARGPYAFADRNQGATSESINITARVDDAAFAPVPITLTEASLDSFQRGKYSIRIPEPIIGLQPGSEVTWGEISFIVKNMAFSIGAGNAPTVQITEA